MVYKFLKLVKREILDFFFPNYCYACKDWIEQGQALCLICMAKISPIVSEKIEVTEKLSVSVFAVSAYKHPLKELVVAKTFQDISACKKLAQLMWEHTNIKNIDFDIIVPVPLYWQKYAHRGYNQTEEIARIFAKLCKKTVVSNAIKRAKNTQIQGLLHFDARQDNLKNAFVLNKKLINVIIGKKVLIIEDLVTTAATIKSFAKELQKAQPKEIVVLAACRNV